MTTETGPLGNIKTPSGLPTDPWESPTMIATLISIFLILFGIALAALPVMRGDGFTPDGLVVGGLGAIGYLSSFRAVRAQMIEAHDEVVALGHDGLESYRVSRGLE